jgi:N-acetylglucosaminyl-diphospho-decaprenol L-rhamnosyltransferase
MHLSQHSSWLTVLQHLLADLQINLMGVEIADMAGPPLILDDNATPDISVVVVGYNTKHLLTPMLAALEASRGDLRLQIIVIDNASQDGSVELLKTEFPNVELLENSINVGFGRANNQALLSARGRYLLLLNPDAFVSKDTLSKTVRFMDEHRRYGVLGVKLVAEDGTLRSCCRNFPTPWNVALNITRLDRFFPKTRLVNDMSWDHASVRACDWVPGCYYMVRREVLETVGLFDPRYFMYCEDVDHCRRVREAGWEVVYYPGTQVVHIGGQSAVTFDEPTDSNREVPALLSESFLLYLRKYHGLTGMLAIALVTILYDVASAFKQAIQKDATLAQERLKHARLVFKLLNETKLASRSTR